MIGVILCGGQSKRMGTDKGLIALGDITWAQAAAAKFSILELQVLYSINTGQLKEYSEMVDAAQLIIDNDSSGIYGPLAGILSVHENYPMQDLFVLACDMPLMEVSVLQQLLNVYHRDNTPDAFVFTNDSEPEPLCAIYSARGLAHIRQLHQSNQLTRHSMKFMLEQINTLFEPLPEDQKKYFRNFNSQTL